MNPLQHYHFYMEWIQVAPNKQHESNHAHQHELQQIPLDALHSVSFHRYNNQRALPQRWQSLH